MNTNDAINEILKQIKQPLWENWYIKQKIGSGAFSAVFKVEAQRTPLRKSISALKIEPITADEKMFIDEERKRNYIDNKRRSAEMEAEIMYNLRKCPYIVSYEEEAIRELYINNEFEGYYYLIRMEFLNAVSTQIRTKSFDFSEKNILKLTSEIGGGIQAAHKLGIIHRDIKLDNFFVDEFGTYKLGDFNISKKTGAARTFAGTPGYLAPEIYRAKSNVDQVYTSQADIYSFGICLYQLANDLFFPFEDGMDLEEAIDKRMEGVELPPPKNASPELAKIILKACEFETEKRYKTVDEMLSDIMSLMYNPTHTSTAAAPNINPIHDSTATVQAFNTTRANISEPLSADDTQKSENALGLELDLGIPNENNQFETVSASDSENQNNSQPNSRGTILAVVDEDESSNTQVQYDLKSTGEFVEFGSYYVAVNNEKMPLRWRILSIEGDKALIITYMGIDVKNFSDTSGKSDWESSSIRKWLNDEFYNTAFSASEKQLIVEADLMNYKNVIYRTSNGGNTKDNVFLLSIEEVQKYFGSDEDRIVKPTAYARSKGVFSAENGGSWWWLRSSGNTEAYAADVDYGGDVDSYGSDRFYGMNCVRPAVWISLAFLNEAKRLNFEESFYNSHSHSLNSQSQSQSRNESVNSFYGSVPLPSSSEGTYAGSISSQIDSSRRIIQFGNYFYENSFSKNPIDWRVLAVENKRALLITDKCIDCLPYNMIPNFITWEISQIRAWLNNEFISLAFTDKEKKLIKPTTLSTPDNPLYSTKGGKMTTDKVFLLSLNEANMYFRSDEDRIAEATPYAKSKGLFVSDNGGSWWWLRSSGNIQSYAADVDYGGDIDLYGNFSLAANAVRPAIWVDVKVLKK